MTQGITGAFGLDLILLSVCVWKSAQGMTIKYLDWD